jgi:hypothetical protein
MSASLSGPCGSQVFDGKIEAEPQRVLVIAVRRFT